MADSTVLLNSFEPLLLITFPIFCHILNSPEFAFRERQHPTENHELQFQDSFPHYFLWENPYFRDDGKRKGWQPAENKNLCSFLDVKQFYFKMNVLGVTQPHSQTDVLFVVFYDR